MKNMQITCKMKIQIILKNPINIHLVVEIQIQTLIKIINRQINQGQNQTHTEVIENLVCLISTTLIQI